MFGPVRLLVERARRRWPMRRCADGNRSVVGVGRIETKLLHVLSSRPRRMAQRRLFFLLTHRIAEANLNPTA